MSKFVAAIDQGTTSTRCMIFNHRGEPVSIHQLEHRQIYPQAGWVEHDALEIWQRTQRVIRGALEKAAHAQDIAAVGITNQRETTVVWNRKTGKPYYNAIVWQDTRTDKLCAELGGSDGPGSFPRARGVAAGHLFLRPQDSLDCSTTCPAAGRCHTRRRPLRQHRRLADLESDRRA
jgi:glycerol kinase